MPKMKSIAAGFFASLLLATAVQAQVTLNSVRIGAADTIATAKFYETAFGMQEVNRIDVPHDLLGTAFHNIEMMDTGKGGDHVALGTGGGLTADDVIQIAGLGGSLYITGEGEAHVNVLSGGFNLAPLSVINSDDTDAIPNGTYRHFQSTAPGHEADLYVATTVTVGV